MVQTLHLYPPETLAVMLDCGLDFALQDNCDGFTPLMRAADLGSVSGMISLLGLSELLGRDVELGFGCANKSRWRNVLHLVALGHKNYTAPEQIMVVELLLAHPDMGYGTANALDIFGQTPLRVAFHWQAISNCASTYLRSPKVFCGRADDFGNTPLHGLFRSALHFLGQQNHQFTPGIVKDHLWRLLRWKAENGAPMIDVFATNYRQGYTALDLACQLGDSFKDIQRTLECVMHGRKRFQGRS